MNIISSRSWKSTIEDVFKIYLGVLYHVLLPKISQWVIESPLWCRICSRLILSVPDSLLENCLEPLLVKCERYAFITFTFYKWTNDKKSVWESNFIVKMFIAEIQWIDSPFLIYLLFHSGKLMSHYIRCSCVLMWGFRLCFLPA